MYTARYFHIKTVVSLFLGCVNGIALGLIVSALNAWLETAGINRTTIGLFALVGAPYMLKFCWSPLIDNIHIPFLSKKIGHRRSWLIITQIFLSLTIISLGLSNPITNTHTFALLAFLVSIFAATQETILDAYRIEMLGDKEQQTLSATSASVGHSVGLVLSGGGTLLIVDSLCQSWEICENFSNWSIAYSIFAIVIFLGSVCAFIIGEPQKHYHKEIKSNTSSFKRGIEIFIVKPSVDFTKHKKWLLILIFVTTYRTCDAFIAPMMNPFFLDIGFTLTEIAIVVKTFGLFATAFGSILGGTLTYHIGITKSLFICGLTQMFSNLMFILQARIGNSISLLYLSITCENIGGAMAIAVFIIYISRLCSSSKYTATQYSLLTALSSVNYFSIASLSGWVAENFGWESLFLTSVILGIPPLIVLLFIHNNKWRLFMHKVV